MRVFIQTARASEPRFFGLLLALKMAHTGSKLTQAAAGHDSGAIFETLAQRVWTKYSLLGEGEGGPGSTEAPLCALPFDSGLQGLLSQVRTGRGPSRDHRPLGLPLPQILQSCG